MGVEEANQAINLFNMDYLSSVTAMVLAVNIITQVIKETFLRENGNERIPKMVTLASSFCIIAVHHYTMWERNANVFNQSRIELVFLIFLNSMLIAGLAMGNYKVLNITKDKEVRRMKKEMYEIQRENGYRKEEQIVPKEEDH